jgi:hypothetical protein
LINFIKRKMEKVTLREKLSYQISSHCSVCATPS